MSEVARHDPFNGDPQRLAADAAAYRAKFPPHATDTRAATMEELIRWCSEKIQEIDAQEPFAPTASYNAGYRVALVTLYWKLGQVIDGA